MSKKPKTFADYKLEGYKWITLANGEYYPDILKDACELYKPVLILFGKLIEKSESSERLLIQISDIPTQWMRIQLARVFRKYVSPATPVEMLKRKTKVKEICDQFRGKFRPIQEVQSAFSNVIYDRQKTILAIGLVRYDSDRGGAQEDDRTGGYHNCADEILKYTSDYNLITKVIFINDGPGLLLGSMWDDYATLEESGCGRIMVSTLRMISERLTLEWLYS
jgi:hypothetical protein